MTGVGLLGFSIGRFLAPETDYQAYAYKPTPKAPAYPGERPVATFATPAPPDGADPLAADAARDALLEVLGEPDLFERTSALLALLPTLGPEAVPAVETLLFEPSRIDRDAVSYVLLVRFWALHEPRAAAMAGLFRMPYWIALSTGAAAVEVWAHADPAAAASAVEGMRISPNHNASFAERALVRGWFDSGLPGLEDFIQGLGVGFSRQRALSAFARRAIQRDGPEAVARWAEAISDEDPDFKLNAFRRVGNELANIDLAAAVAWCDAHCQGPYGSNMMSGIAVRWARRDGPAMMEWLSKAPAGLERGLAVLKGYREWLAVDRTAATAYLEAIGPDGAEDWLRPAANSYVVLAALRDPEKAMKWAAIIENDRDREFAFVATAQRWRQKDAAAADAWIDASPLSEEARAKARTAPAGPPRLAAPSEPTPDDLKD